MATMREFLETYPLYKKLSIPTQGWGDWPETLTAWCRVCGTERAFHVWPRKLTGFVPDGGVYMLEGTCERCARNGLILWVDVNADERWMQKAGQLPGPAVEAGRARGKSRLRSVRSNSTPAGCLNPS